MYIAAFGAEPILLVGAGALVNTIDNRGGAPIQVTAFHKGCNLMEILIRNGAEILAANTDGRAPLHGAADKGIGAGSRAASWERCRSLIRK